MADAEHLAGRKDVDVPDVEQKSPATEAEIDEDPRVGEDVVDQPGLDEPSHGNFPLGLDIDSVCIEPDPISMQFPHRFRMAMGPRCNSARRQRCPATWQPPAP